MAEIGGKDEAYAYINIYIFFYTEVHSLQDKVFEEVKNHAFLATCCTICRYSFSRGVKIHAKNPGVALYMKLAYTQVNIYIYFFKKRSLFTRPGSHLK